MDEKRELAGFGHEKNDPIVERQVGDCSSGIGKTDTPEEMISNDLALGVYLNTQNMSTLCVYRSRVIEKNRLGSPTIPHRSYSYFDINNWCVYDLTNRSLRGLGLIRITDEKIIAVAKTKMMNFVKAEKSSGEALLKKAEDMRHSIETAF